MTNSIYGIPNIKIKTFCLPVIRNYDEEVNEFLKEHDGDILDIQHQLARPGMLDHISIMVIYTEKDKPGKKGKK